MSSDVIISVEGLGKMYRIRHQPEGRRYVALRDVIAEKAKGVLKMLKSKNPISAFQRFSISAFSL